MHEYLVDGKVKARIWQLPENVESSAWDQIKNMCRHPYIQDPIALMPDIHYGIGATVGAVIPFNQSVCPSAVGSDIGCGMLSLKTNLHVDAVKPKLKELIRSIHRSIPMGYNWRNNQQMKIVEENIDANLKEDLKGFKDVLPQLGTLGGGNHFIEIQTDEQGNVWIMIHSGSRNFGKLTSDTFIKRAKEVSKNTPKDLEVLEKGTDDFNSYMTFMKVCIQFAANNRNIMSLAIKKEMEHYFGEVKFVDTIHVPHNYAFDIGETILHRKGATAANLNTRGVIPGNSKSPSYIVKGLGNPLSYESCSHGAGRIMSRGQAKRTITLEQFQESMKDVVSECVTVNHLDEAPDVYKKIDEIMELQKDLVKIEVKLIPIGNCKG